MKILFLDAQMGASGDMLTAALFELIEDKDIFLNKINSLGLAGVKFEAKKTIKKGISGTKINVIIDGMQEESEDLHHSHNAQGKMSSETPQKETAEILPSEANHNHKNFKTIEGIIDKLPLSQKVKENAREIYLKIAEAESLIHQKDIYQIHFHELGNLDAIADIAAVCLLLEMLNVDKIIASPINVGGGFVKCAHGILPVPAPATAEILKGLPIYSSGIFGELTTPTGAALLKRFVSEFAQMPQMTIEKIGYGFGKKDFETLNALRAFLGKSNKTIENNLQDLAVKLECNLDDICGEAISYAAEILMKEGALDVWLQNIQMKKNRPGILLSCLCAPDKADFFASLILKHTSTFGVRKTLCCRYKLEREIKTIKTKLGNVGVKEGKGWGAEKSKYEFNDIAGLAAENNLSIEETIRIVKSEKLFE